MASKVISKMAKSNFYFFLILTLLCFNCQNNTSIEGLWLVKSVSVANNEMTPNARWTRFNSDYTQESGNGWFQHSYGNYNFDEIKKELSISTKNGLNDPFPPFKVRLEKDSMFWSRIEEGEQINVLLVRINVLPQTHGDQLLGLWKLEESEGQGLYYNEASNKKNSDYLHLKWDKRFVIGSDDQKIRGIYNVHGHKKEIEFIPFDSDYNRSYWKINFNNASISLKLLNSDSTVNRNFTRIYDYPSQ